MTHGICCLEHNWRSIIVSPFLDALTTCVNLAVKHVGATLDKSQVLEKGLPNLSKQAFCPKNIFSLKKCQEYIQFDSLDIH